MIERIVAELDLTTVEGLYLASMLAVGFMGGARGGELHHADREDFSLTHFRDGVNWTLPFSKTDQANQGVVRGFKHRRGCKLAGVANDGGASLCAPCVVNAWLAATKDIADPTWPMWPCATTQFGAVKLTDIADMLRHLVTKINASDKPFVDPRTGVVVQPDPADVMGSSFRRSGCQGYLQSEGATKSGAMWWGRWTSAQVFELYAHDIATPLNDPQNLTDLMHDARCERGEGSPSAVLQAEVITAAVKEGIAAAGQAAAAEVERLRRDLEAETRRADQEKGDAQAQKARADKAEGAVEVLKDVLGGLLR